MAIRKGRPRKAVKGCRIQLAVAVPEKIDVGLAAGDHLAAQGFHAPQLCGGRKGKADFDGPIHRSLMRWRSFGMSA
jgi:hypothetical protein